MQPRESNSEVDNDENYSNQQENHILHNGTDVATECHVSTLLGVIILSSVVVIRSLRVWKVNSNESDRN